MTRFWPLAVVLALLALLVSPRIASASSGVQPETRVGGFDLFALPLVGLLAAPSAQEHSGNSVAYDETARGYSLAAEGAEGATAAAQTEVNLTKTVAAHATDVIKRGPFRGDLARPYVNSPLTIQEVMQAAEGVPDPGGVAGALRWDVPGAFRGAEGTWQLVYDPATNTVLHFNFVVP